MSDPLDAGAFEKLVDRLVAECRPGLSSSPSITLASPMIVSTTADEVLASHAAALADVQRLTVDAARWRFVASHLHVCEVSEPEGRPAVFCGDEHGNIPVLNDALEQLYLDAFHDPKRTLPSIDEVVDAARFADAPGEGH